MKKQWLIEVAEVRAASAARRAQRELERQAEAEVEAKVSRSTRLNNLADTCFAGAVIIAVAVGMVLVVPGVYILVLGTIAAVAVAIATLVAVGALYESGIFVGLFFGRDVFEAGFKIVGIILLATIQAASGRSD